MQRLREELADAAASGGCTSEAQRQRREGETQDGAVGGEVALAETRAGGLCTR